LNVTVLVSKWPVFFERNRFDFKVVRIFLNATVLVSKSSAFF